MRNINSIDYCFLFIFFLLAFFVFYGSAFGIIDDHTLVQTLFVEKNIPFFIQPQIGRFYPLDGQELNILSHLFSPSPQIFYTFNAICFVIVVFLLSQSFYILFKSRFEKAKIFAYLATLVIVTTPAFMTSWLRLFVPERMEFVFLSIFFYSYVLLYTQSTKRVRFASIVCFLSSLIALFYKETAFVLLGVFAFCHIVFAYWNKEKIFKMDYLLLLNCLIWIICYIFFVLLQKDGGGIYGDSPYNRLLLFARNFAHYFFNDPFLIFSLVPVLLLRLWSVVFKKQKIYPLYDSMLISSSIFLCAYFYLGLSDVHYSLPAYIMAIPPLFICCRIYCRNGLMKLSCVFLGAMLVLNYIPMSLQYAIRYKFVPQNFQKTLEFLKEYAKGKKIDIYLDGVNRASNVEVYVSFQKWMEFYGIKNFDFFSDIPIDHALLGKENPNSPYSVFRSNSVVQKKKGDIVILLPYTNLFVDNEKIAKMCKEYKLLYIADSGLNVPFYGIQTFLKKEWAKTLQNRNDINVSQNIYRLPIYFYVFEVQ